MKKSRKNKPYKFTKMAVGVHARNRADGVHPEKMRVGETRDDYLCRVAVEKEHRTLREKLLGKAGRAA